MPLRPQETKEGKTLKSAALRGYRLSLYLPSLLLQRPRKPAPDRRNRDLTQQLWVSNRLS